jgi:hypothetical protein
MPLDFYLLQLKLSVEVSDTIGIIIQGKCGKKFEYSSEGWTGQNSSIPVLIWLEFGVAYHFIQLGPAYR